MPDTELAPLAPAAGAIEDTIPLRFENVVRRFADRVALTGRGRQWTYAALNRRANQLAHGIRARTAPGPGCVAHLSSLSPEMVIVTLAVLKAGKTCLAIHPGMPDDARTALVKDASPDLVVAGESFDTAARAAAAGTCDVLDVRTIGDSTQADDPGPIARPDDPALITYTSGSTGRPKGVVWNHRALLHRASRAAQGGTVTPDDRQSLLRHCAFAAAQTDVVVTLLNGATLCTFDVTAAGFAAFHTWLDEERITVIRVPTLLLRRFLASLEPGRMFPGVRIVSVGGDTVLPADLDRWKQHFLAPCTLHVRFSASETGVLTTARFDHHTVLGPEGATAGHPVPEKELFVVDDGGRPVGVDEEGDLLVSSAYLSDGYWRRPEDTARAFAPDPRNPGRRTYRTGDRGRLLADGRFAFTGRRDQQVKIRGYRVDPREVEAALRQMDDLLEAAVVPVKEHEDQRLLGFVVLRPGATFDQAALRARLLTRLPEWKVPSRLFAMDALPTTLSGKVDRQRLKEEGLRQEAAAAAAPAASEPLDALETRIADLWRQLLRCGALDPASDFFLVGGDSLQATVLHLNVERLTGTLIPIDALFEQPTVRGMANVVRRFQRPGTPAVPTLPPVLVPFRATGARSPLFLMHGRPGWSFVRPEFLAIVGEDQPVYGFQAAGLVRSWRRRNTIENMARQYIAAMREVQPAGPYFIGSACIGFLVAIEMANQLRAAGELVAPLLFIDPTSLGQIDALFMPAWRRYRRIVRLQLKRWSGWSSWHERKRKGLEEKWGDQLRHDPLGYEAGLRLRVNANLDFAIARLKYVRWRYDGSVLILRSTRRLNRDAQADDDGAFGGRLTGEVRLFEAGSTHHEVIRAQSELAARQIRQCIDLVHEEIARLRAQHAGAPAHARSPLQSQM